MFVTFALWLVSLISLPLDNNCMYIGSDAAVIVIGNVHGDQSSNPRQSCLHFTDR